MYKYPHLRDKQNLFEALKEGSKGAKWSLKSGILGAKSRNFGLKKYEPGTNLERQSGANCRRCSRKCTKDNA